MAIALRRRPENRRGDRLIAAPALPQAAGTPVDVALVLAIDVSGSVSEQRMRLQIEGYAEAIQHPDFLAAVSTGPLGRIGLTFVEWSEVRRQTQAVGWRVIADAAGRDAFVAALLAAERPMPGWTSISAAIDYAVALLAHNGLVAERRVIDISGDGVNNDGRPAAAARDDAVAAGITINGLPITEVEPGLAAYYRANVIGGPDSFLMVADSMRSFGAAILRKLLVEVAGLRAGKGEAVLPYPVLAGEGPPSTAFVPIARKRRGWRAFARHDGVSSAGAPRPLT